MAVGVKEGARTQSRSQCPFLACLLRHREQKRLGRTTGEFYSKSSVFIFFQSCFSPPFQRGLGVARGAWQPGCASSGSLGLLLVLLSHPRCPVSSASFSRLPRPPLHHPTRGWGWRTTFQDVALISGEMGPQGACGLVGQHAGALWGSRELGSHPLRWDWMRWSEMWWEAGPDQSGQVDTGVPRAGWRSHGRGGGWEQLGLWFRTLGLRGPRDS